MIALGAPEESDIHFEKSDVFSVPGECHRSGAAQVGAKSPSRLSAKDRWRVLREAIKKKGTASQFLKTPGSKCGILSYSRVSDQCYKMTLPGSCITVKILLPSNYEQVLTPQQLMGFDNTGNVCIWSSEEILLLYVKSQLKSFSGKRVLEVAGGSTALAGLWLSLSGVCSSITLSDGHPKCVSRIRDTVAQNSPLPTPTSIQRIMWGAEQEGENKENEGSLYDVILAADCVFNEKTHESFSSFLWDSLVPGGHVILVAPHRQYAGISSLTSFAALMSTKGFIPSDSSLSITKDVHDALTKMSKILSDNHRPHLLLLHKPNMTCNGKSR